MQIDINEKKIQLSENCINWYYEKRVGDVFYKQWDRDLIKGINMGYPHGGFSSNGIENKEKVFVFDYKIFSHFWINAVFYSTFNLSEPLRGSYKTFRGNSEWFMEDLYKNLKEDKYDLIIVNDFLCYLRPNSQLKLIEVLRDTKTTVLLISNDVLLLNMTGLMNECQIIADENKIQDLKNFLNKF